MKKNKFVLLFVAIALLFTVTGCGGPREGSVAYQNYNQIVVGTTTYNEAVVLMGAPDESITLKRVTWTNITYEAAPYTFAILFTPNDIVAELASPSASYPTLAPANQIVVGTTTYAQLITLFGASTTTAQEITIRWFDEAEGYDITVEFNSSNVVVEMTDLATSGLYDTIYTTPIGVKTGAWEWIIAQIGWFMYNASNLFGLLGNTYLYWIGLLLMTLTIRTLAWPVYAKSNDMTLKMQLAQPDLGRVQEKYRGRTDQASQQRMQLETMEIYKKYKINFLGCLMPLAQMPIFIAMYQVVQRFPLQGTIIPGADIAAMNTNFLWTNLGNTEIWANLPLAIVVSATMFLSQWLMTKRTAVNTKNPRYQNPQAQQTQKTMKYMMYFMTLMMGYIAITNAGIAYYWIIGNVYQLFQSHVSHKNMGTRQDKLRSQVK
jgi:YidC/Oxa1 family membrane protein insertase